MTPPVTTKCVLGENYVQQESKMPRQHSGRESSSAQSHKVSACFGNKEWKRRTIDALSNQCTKAWRWETICPYWHSLRAAAQHTTSRIVAFPKLGHLCSLVTPPSVTSKWSSVPLFVNALLYINVKTCKKKNCWKEVRSCLLLCLIT